MSSLLRRGLHGTSVLGVVCACLAGVIYFELTWPDVGPSIAAATTPAPSRRPASTGRTFAVPPMTEYSEVVERPLFYPTRRSSLPQTVEERSTTNLTLIGTVMSGTTRHALVRHKQGSRVERVIEGQDIDGWTVESIQGDRVVLSHDDRRLSLKASAREAKQ
jgi:type II secretory pathway component PulC